MPDMIEFREDAFAWPKGATYWGEPLPFIQTVDGKKYIVYDGWWTTARIDQLSAWAHEASRFIRNVLGSDRNQQIRARARVFMDRAERWKEEGKLNLTALFQNWTPSTEEQEQIDQLVLGYVKTREWARGELAKAWREGSEISDDLPGEPETWNEVNMTGAAFRLPKLLMAMVRLGEVPDPGMIVPEKALV